MAALKPHLIIGHCLYLAIQLCHVRERKFVHGGRLWVKEERGRGREPVFLWAICMCPSILPKCISVVIDDV